jgi:hypothetical protein
MVIFFNKGSKTAKMSMRNYVVHNLHKENTTEILKSTIYAPENYLLRAFKEEDLFKMINTILIQKVSDLDFNFDSVM